MGHQSQQQNQFQKVLFEIDALPVVSSKGKLFADIRLHTRYPNEYEHHLKLVFDQMKEQNGIGETDLRILAKFLTKMGKFDLAEFYYHRLMDQIPSNDPSLIPLYEQLDQIASQRGDFDRSLQWQEKLLSLKQQKTSSILLKKLKRYPTGDTYQGEFLNDLYHGFGIYTWKNGDRYQGQGIYFQANGDTYHGEFQDDKSHGRGIYRTKNGKCLDVVYDHDDLISSKEKKK